MDVAYTGTGAGTGTGTGTGSSTVAKTDLSEATVSSIAKKTYTGSAIKPKPTVTVNGEKLQLGADYTLSYKNNKKVGTATVTVTAAANSTKYTGSTSTTFRIVKAANTLSVAAASPTTKAGKAVKALYVANAKGSVTYTRVSGSKYLSLGANGKIKVAKGTPSGTYKIRVKVRAAGTANYKPKSVYKTISVTVR